MALFNDGMSNSLLLENLNQKNEKAWEELYRYYYAPLCSYAEQLTGNAEVGEDVVQECLIRLWQARVEFKERRALIAWLYRSVYNASVSVLRERQIHGRAGKVFPVTLVEDEEEAQRLAVKEETISRFYELLEQLPAQQRDILLYSLKGMKVSEIAASMNISENTVKTQKKRVYLFMREHFDSDTVRLLWLWLVRK